MAAATLITPRYSAEDFETRSIQSAAPSYISEVPSYHTTAPHPEPIPAYSPRNTTATDSSSTQPRRQGNTSPQQAQPQYGLPPIPDVPPRGTPSLQGFRVPTWSTHNAPAARQYRSVIERRATASSSSVPRTRWSPRQEQPEPEISTRVPRPLEDPYLVGELAAAEARAERLRRENGDDILLREDKHWDWLLAQMQTWEQREKSWAKFRSEHDRVSRRSLLRGVRGRLS